MRLEVEHQASVMRVRVSEKALVKRPDWDQVLALRGPSTALVVLDLGEADFISSLFLEGCVELARALSSGGQQLALLHLAAHQQRLLEFVDGASRLLICEDEKGIEECLRSLKPDAGAGERDEGVTRAEKLMLWN